MNGRLWIAMAAAWSLVTPGLVGTVTAQATGSELQAAAQETLPRRIQIGATLAAVPDSVRSRGAPGGAYVVSVIPNSSAADAGVRAGDVIVRIGSDSVVDVPSALAALRVMAAGTTNSIRLVRNGTRLEVSFRARERPRETSNDFVIEYSAVAAVGGRHRILVTHPADGGRHPAILLIGGIGCYSIDGALGNPAVDRTMTPRTGGPSEGSPARSGAPMPPMLCPNRNSCEASTDGMERIARRAAR